MVLKEDGASFVVASARVQHYHQRNQVQSHGDATQLRAVSTRLENCQVGTAKGAVPMPRHMTRLFVFLALGSLSFACHRSAPQITLATFSKALGNAPYHVAKSKGWFAEAPELRGTRLVFAEFNDRPTISTAFDTGSLDVLFSAEAPAYLCRAQGNDIRVTGVNASATQEILVPITSGLKSPADLKGRKVAVQQGTSSHYCLLRILGQFKLLPNDLDLVYMPAAEARSAFEAGRLDAWAVWAPWVEQQEVRNSGRVLVGGEAVIHSTVTMRRRLYQEHREQAVAILRALQRAKAWISENEVEAEAIAARELGLDLSVVQRAWAKFDWAPGLTPTIIADFQEKANFLTAQDKTRLGQPLDVQSQFVETGLLQAH